MFQNAHWLKRKTQCLRQKKAALELWFLGSGESSWGLCQYKQAIRKISAPKGFRFIDNPGKLCIRKKSEGMWQSQKMVALEPSCGFWWPQIQQAAHVGSQSLCLSQLRRFWGSWRSRTALGHPCVLRIHQLSSQGADELSCHQTWPVWEMDL